MKVILDRNIEDNIWDEIKKRFRFYSIENIRIKPIVHNIKYEVFKFMDGKSWSDEQEKIVNNIFKEISNNDIYALDWNHDCFEFNPREEIPLYYKYYDIERELWVYFPSYYPDGDYYFFISKDFSYGLLGHPWRREICVFGDEFLNKFKQHINELGLLSCNDNNI